MITTDLGAQFQSTVFEELTNLLVVKHITTIGYHLCANGLIERFHRQLTAALTANNYPGTGLENLPLVLLSIRNVIKQDLGYTASEMVLITYITLPWQFSGKTITYSQLHFCTRFQTMNE